MVFDRILFPVTTLGPGKRVALWTSGCSKHCQGCANPELWDARAGQEQQVETVAGMLRFLHEERGAHRLTLTGGDPLEQATDLLDLLVRVREGFDDILLYTGYTLVEARVLLGETMGRIESQVDVIVDGRYVEALNDGVQALVGSANQKVHVLTPSLSGLYARYLEGGRLVQNFVFGGRAISVGIHRREG